MRRPQAVLEELIAHMTANPDISLSEWKAQRSKCIHDMLSDDRQTSLDAMSQVINECIRLADIRQKRQNASR